MAGNNISAGLEILMGGRSMPRETGTGKDSGKESSPKQSLAGKPVKSRIPDRIYTSLVVNREKYAKVKAIALHNGLNVNEVIDAALDMAIREYEKRNGTVDIREDHVSAAEILFNTKG